MQYGTVHRFELKLTAFMGSTSFSFWSPFFSPPRCDKFILFSPSVHSVYDSDDTLSLPHSVSLSHIKCLIGSSHCDNSLCLTGHSLGPRGGRGPPVGQLWGCGGHTGVPQTLPVPQHRAVSTHLDLSQSPLQSLRILTSVRLALYEVTSNRAFSCLCNNHNRWLKALEF